MLTGPAAFAALVAVAGALAQPAPEPPPSGDGWGSVSCSETPSPACDLGAGSGGAPAPDADLTLPDDPGPRSGGADEAAQPVDGVRCSYVISDFRPPGGGLVPASFGTPPRGPAAVVVVPAATRRERQPEPGEDGAWYLWRCPGDGFRDSLYRAPVWIPDGEQVPGAERPSAADLAEQARDRLRLPDPAVAASPVGDQLVNLPTWLWLDGDWAPVEATASVPGVSVTARAVPESATWSMGDGSEVVCRGPGTPYAPGTDPASPSPDCGHTYGASSAGRPGETFAVAVTVSWTVTWSGAGDGGTFPGLTTTSEAGFRVAESQALVTGGG
ncbi:hypothetical protein [Pseudonocardia sp.]|uniref:hypothetical protein n=1 Tax=Pseudonocardia sp. TaxID=60912 RepID=UPI002609AE8B|nr:hypothetical protein [Pseudonocardia sp.]